MPFEWRATGMFWISRPILSRQFYFREYNLKNLCIVYNLDGAARAAPLRLCPQRILKETENGNEHSESILQSHSTVNGILSTWQTPFFITRAENGLAVLYFNGYTQLPFSRWGAAWQHPSRRTLMAAQGSLATTNTMVHSVI